MNPMLSNAIEAGRTVHREGYRTPNKKTLGREIRSRLRRMISPSVGGIRIEGADLNNTTRVFRARRAQERRDSGIIVETENRDGERQVLFELRPGQDPLPDHQELPPDLMNVAFTLDQHPQVEGETISYFPRAGEILQSPV